jgi:hypothetical protein
MYALAATAAGVGILALTPSAAGKVIYTKVHKVVQYNHGPLYFDLNNAGVKDFALAGQLTTTTSGEFVKLNVYAAHAGNAVWTVQSSGHYCAAAAHQGSFIGPKRKFSPNTLTMFLINTLAGSGTEHCPWVNVPYAYLGLKIEISGKKHYGWALVEFMNGSTILAGYAYENIPNKPIVAGKTKGPADDSKEEDVGPGAFLTAPTPANLQPATLGALAMGAPGLSIWRRNKSVGAGR